MLRLSLLLMYLVGVMIATDVTDDDDDGDDVTDDDNSITLAQFTT